MTEEMWLLRWGQLALRAGESSEAKARESAEAKPPEPKRRPARRRKAPAQRGE